MTTYSEITNQIADQWIAALKNAEQLVGVASGGAQRLTQSLPLPAVPAPFQELNEIITDKLPEPQEVVRANFEFTNRLLEAQRDFTLKLLENRVTGTPATAAPADEAATA